MKDNAKQEPTNVKWISAKTKPEPLVSVLVFIPEEDDHVTTGMWDISNKWVLLDEYRVPNSEVTYWAEMVPLPDDRTFNKARIPNNQDETMSATISRLQKSLYELENKLAASELLVNELVLTMEQFIDLTSDYDPGDALIWAMRTDMQFALRKIKH